MYSATPTKHVMPELNLMPDRIVLNGEHSLEEWSDLLNCEEKDLIKAMSIMGNSVQAVDDYLILNRQKKC